MAAHADDTSTPRTAIAVCGCGHDGRLGIGSNAPATLHEVTLLDDFLTNPSSQQNSSSTPSPPGPAPGAVLQVACGAYHTLVRTTTGLFGWGLHEDGQLGLGRPSSAAASASTTCTAASCDGNARHEEEEKVVPPSFDRPTYIPFAELIKGGGGGGRRGHVFDKSAEGSATTTDAGEGQGWPEIISVHCGADHSVVRTSDAVYVTGRNDCGQLGLGHTNAVYCWTLLCKTSTAPATPAAASLPPPPFFLALPGFTRADGSSTRVVGGRLTHISCGTHHTLLALASALVLHTSYSTSSSSLPTSLSQQASVATAPVQPRHRLCFYPALLLACGRGDFGELGYDGDAWAVLQAKAQRQERALLAEATRPPLQEEVSSVDGVSATTSAAAPYKFKWKAVAAAKQRRPPFSSPFLRPVEVRELTECARELQGRWADEVGVAVANSDAEHDVASCLSPTARESLGQLLQNTSVRRAEEQETTCWDVVMLQAMHHHSAVTLRACRPPSPAVPVPLRVLHWGCYYCSEVEDAAASLPRPLIDSSEGRRRKTDDVAWGLHAGDEVLFRYAAVGAARPFVQVIGTGNIGRGNGDDEARTWADVPLLPASTVDVVAQKRLSASSITGRFHFLISLSEQAAVLDLSGNESNADCVSVIGFGDNLHGQLGVSATRLGVERTAAANGVDEDDAVLAPRPLLEVGDTLRTATAVKRSLRDAATPLHVRRVERAETEASTAERWVVENIRAVGAGARHSVFVVDVRSLQSGRESEHCPAER